MHFGMVATDGEELEVLHQERTLKNEMQHRKYVTALINKSIIYSVISEKFHLQRQSILKVRKETNEIAVIFLIKPFFTTK